jgi:hypothetical protein
MLRLTELAGFRTLTCMLVCGRGQRNSETKTLHELYLDTEFNGHGGELVSLALDSSSGSGKHFYEILPPADKWHPWVAENVVPHLEKKPVSRIMFGAKLREYLQGREPCTICADWPADFQHLMDCMCGAAFGDSWMAECTMVLMRGTDPRPAVPHNALSDGIALRDWHLATNNDSK